MKKQYYILLGVFLVIILGGVYVVSVKTNTNPINSSNPTQTNLQKNGKNQNKNSNGDNYNKQNCLADDCLAVSDLEYPVASLPDSVQQALNEAINDEYKALATYQAVIQKFGSVRPFSMIKGAEEQHIASIKAIYDKYGLTVPTNTYLGNVEIPDTLQQACQIGVDAEIANASLYQDTLLPAVKEYEDITLVFNNLMNASQQKHLPAFERCN